MSRPKKPRQNGYFTDGVNDEVYNKLASLPLLIAISRDRTAGGSD
jgi:hypothetical protein